MVSSASASKQFQLRRADGEPHPDVPVPHGVSYFCVNGNSKAPRCLSVPPTGEAARRAYLLEPVRRGHESLLLLLAAPTYPVRVNGEFITHCACLREQDVIQLDDGTAYQVLVQVRSVIGSAPAEYADKDCPICHAKIGKSIVYLCPACSGAVHCDRSGGEKARNCLLGSECPACHARIAFQDPGPGAEE